MTSTGSSSSVATADTAPATVDLVVGLTSYQAASTIGGVAEAVRNGVARFQGVSNRIVLVDAGSTDGTAARAREALAGAGELVEIPPARAPGDLLELPYHGMPGKARALHAILTQARQLGARACVVLDAGVQTVAPQWLELLAGPILQHDFDLVAPVYRRHAFEGALTKGIVYPLFRALYGARLRQPAGAEFACSQRLLDRFLQEDVWDRDGSQVGIDLWLATAAASGDFRLGEAALGIRRSPPRGDAALDLPATVRQVVGSLLADLEGRVERWQRVRGSTPVQQFGELPPTPPSEGPTVDPERLMESYRLGYRELRDIWTYVLPPRTIIELRRLIDGPPAAFRMDDELWARIVYDFALGFRLRVLARDHLLQSLVPLYLGWLASFVLQVRDRPHEVVHETVERLGAAFETQTSSLIARWRWPERFRH